MERDIISDFINWNNGISTHTLTWSVTIDKVGRMIFVDNFNSHAHVERDFCQVNTFISIMISTHTLTWSVTLAEIYNKGTWKISTHTLTWSVTG